jgi:hypothetical protein
MGTAKTEAVTEINNHIIHNLYTLIEMREEEKLAHKMPRLPKCMEACFLIPAII